MSDGFQKLYIFLIPGSGVAGLQSQYEHVCTSFTLRLFVLINVFVIDLSDFHGMFHLQPLSKFQNKIQCPQD